MSALELELARIRAAAVADLVDAARRAAAAPVATPPRPCVYCGAGVNVRCCEFGRDR
jgi:hypothetical protein